MDPALSNLNKFLSSFNKFIVTTHESPDADGLGAEIAFHELLQYLGKEVIIINGDETPDKYQFIDIDNEINIITDTYELPNDIKDYALFVLDTNDFPNTGAVCNVLEDKIKNIFIIDHHEGGPDLIKSNYIKIEASSASEIIHDIIMHFTDKLSFKAAQALYTGILFDTGSFRYPKTSPKTFRIIANLVEKGANPTEIYERIYENNSIDSFVLRSKMLSTMEIHFGGRMILMHLTPEMLKETGAAFSDGELNINLPLTLKDVVVSVLLKQDIDGPLKVSMRTKGDRDVSQIAITRHGGGHKNAAGYKTTLTRDNARQQVIQDMQVFFI
jgi:bifunctional oligoribonuclease and PAP phosphatase NrnA